MASDPSQTSVLGAQDERDADDPGRAPATQIAHDESGENQIGVQGYHIEADVRKSNLLILRSSNINIDD
jgi:hypothetical protein